MAKACQVRVAIAISAVFRLYLSLSQYLRNESPSPVPRGIREKRPLGAMLGGFSRNFFNFSRKNHRAGRLINAIAPHLVPFRVAILAQKAQVAPVQRDVRVVDVLRSQCNNVMHFGTGRYDPALHAVLAQTALALLVCLPARLPCRAVVKRPAEILSHVFLPTKKASAVPASSGTLFNAAERSADDSTERPRTEARGRGERGQ